jgi:4'-phosphopantetheinyl transferase
MSDLPSVAEVHLWFARLDLPVRDVDRFATLLSSDEIARANRYYHERDRRRFIVARGRLRQLLGEYVGREPEHITFHYSERGKPSIPSCLQFNVSHSGETACFGFGRETRVGVDVERVREITETLALTKRFFCAKEHELVSRHPEKERVFFQLWTAKEAYLKAIGTGIAGGLHRVEVSLDPLALGNVAGEWSLFSYQPDERTIATLAVEGKERRVKTFGLSGI